MTNDELLKLSSLFYQGALSNEAWQEGLHRLATVTGSQAASIVLWDRRIDGAVVGDQIGLPSEMQHEYAQHFHTLDPGREQMDRIGIGEWYLDERDLGRQVIGRSAFYQDFLGRYELDSTMASPIFRSESGIHGFLSLSSRSGSRDLAKVSYALAELMPHLEQAARMRLKFLALSNQVDLSAHILDRFQFPLVVVTAARSVVLANRQGEEWLGTPGNPLANRSSDSSKVTALLRDACGSRGECRTAGLQLRKLNGSAYFLTAVPIPATSLVSRYASTPAALLLINDPAQGRQPTGELLKQLFQLTPAEIRLIHSLLQGSTLQEAAARLNISIETGRTQLKSIFNKLNIRRQSELQRLLGWMDIV